MASSVARSDESILPEQIKACGLAGVARKRLRLAFERIQVHVSISRKHIRVRTGGFLKPRISYQY